VRRRAGRRGRLAAAGLWALQMVAYQKVFELPHRRHWRQRERLRVSYPIRIDAALGGGTPPSQRVQRALRRPPEITALDRAVTFVYWAWEAEPHAALAWVLLRHERRFARAAAMVGGVFWSTLVFHALVPTAPPWWASEVAGEMDGEVHRVMLEVKRDLRHENRMREQHSLGANPWASMPSNHLASSAMTAMVLWEIEPRIGACAWGYSAALAFALVYLGEHYVCDLVGGLAAAAAVQAGASRLLRRPGR
jgi:membrane-associated phospholipid phosphatase